MNQSDFRLYSRQDHAFELDDLKQGAVHLWHLSLDAAESHGKFGPAAALTPEERARAARIQREPIRQRFVSARILLRTILGRYLRCPPETLTFELGEHGKPRLAGTRPDHGLVFNVSHTGKELAVALAFNAQLGVDIEAWRPIEDCSALAARCLAPAELGHWNNLLEEERLPAFFRLWTLKEAFCKAVGRGLALGLQQCVFDCSAPEPVLLAWPRQHTEPERRWHFYEIANLSSTSGAIACDRAAKSLLRFDSTSICA